DRARTRDVCEQRQESRHVPTAVRLLLRSEGAGRLRVPESRRRAGAVAVEAGAGGNLVEALERGLRFVPAEARSGASEGLADALIARARAPGVGGGEDGLVQDERPPGRILGIAMRVRAEGDSWSSVVLEPPDSEPELDTGQRSLQIGGQSDEELTDRRRNILEG